MSDSSELKNKLIHKNKTKKSKLKQFIVQKEEKKGSKSTRKQSIQWQ
jgi:hypothetical protein